MRSLLAVLIAGVVGLVGCTRENEPWPSWTIDVPSEAAVLNVTPLLLGERREVVELREEWAVGGDDAGPEYMFSYIGDVDVDADGRVYVFDGGNDRVQVLDGQGRFQRTIGGVGGPGPGELSGGGRLVVVDDRVALVHGLGFRLSVWDQDGEFLWERNLRVPRPLFPVAGLTGGAFVTRRTMPASDGQGTEHVMGRFSVDGEEMLAYAQVAEEELAALRRPGLMRSARLPRARPAVAASSSGDVYVARGDEYQVLAFDSMGAPRWALRARWSRIPVSNEEIARRLAELRESVPDALESEINWPASYPALSVDRGGEEFSFPPIEVDGHGHLWVFPFATEGAVPEGLWPADVYSRDGELLFSGFIEYRDWIVAKGDHVYGAQVDPVSQETMLAKYRLIEPF